MNYSEIVREYYQRVDAGDIEWVVSMFLEDGTYDRAGIIYSGKDAIRRFYEEDRKVSFTHSNIKLWDVSDDIFVEGDFAGKGQDGSLRKGQFSDHWTFNKDGKVTLRRTSLFVGSDYIKA
jgi:ketosteroid isomerase-like protein